AEREMLPMDYGQSDPSRGQDAAEMAVREERDVAPQHPKSGNEAVGTLGNLRRRLAVRAAVPKQIPIGPRLMDFHWSPSLIVAVIRLGKFRFYPGLPFQSNEGAGLLRALPRAGQHGREPDVVQGGAEPARLVLAMRGQRNLRATGMLARNRPFGLAVANV